MLYLPIYMMRMRKNRVTLFNTPVDVLSKNETVEFIDESIQKGHQMVHTCINANKVVMMETDEELHKSVSEADIISADGQAVVWASQLLKKPLPERVPGIDLMESLLEMAFKKGYSAFFFGAREEVVENVVKMYSEIYSPSLIGGYRNGYYNYDELEGIAKQINDSGSELLFVAVPSPKKENFINQFQKSMPNVKLLMGVGGSFDVVTGRVKRAPAWMQDNGLEWLYRLIQEPGKMWRRYLIGNLKYIQIVIREMGKK